MPTVAVLEPAPLLVPRLLACLPPGPVGLTANVTDCDLLVVGPGWTGPVPVPRRVLLTPGRPGQAPMTVSYGPSPRDTITFSSLTPAALVLALQREVVTLDGRRVERQELPVPLWRTPADTLAWAGTLLLAGADPGDLMGTAR